MFEEEHLDDADVVVISYGITSRVAQKAIEMVHVFVGGRAVDLEAVRQPPTGRGRGRSN